MSDIWQLVRPRIVAMVLFGMAVAAWTAGTQAPPWPVLLSALAGTTLVIVGAIALNQRLEHHGDARMARTAGRPLPAGRLGRRQVTVFGIVASCAGLTYLILTADAQLVVLAGASWLIYVGTYTPLKRLTVWQTPIGAAAGAMPMLLGAAAAGAPWSTMAVTLFGIVYFWQFPHAMAIAWLYREQFAAAEVKLATVVDPSGRMAAGMATVGAALLLPVSLVPPWCELAGPGYAVMAIVLGLGYVGLTLRFCWRREDETARALLRGSLVYLPVLLAVLVLSVTR